MGDHAEGADKIKSLYNVMYIHEAHDVHVNKVELLWM